jgi:hypothetical protein
LPWNRRRLQQSALRLLLVLIVQERRSHRARARNSEWLPNEVLELKSLYPQPVRTQGGGGVEYLPAPRQKEA